MRKIHLLSVLILVVLLVKNSRAQSVELTEISKKEFKGVHPIMDNSTNEVKGYYCYYVRERQGKETEFVVALFNKSLVLIKQTPIVMTKRSAVDGSCFNGKEFLFVFNDPVKKALSYVSMDTTGKIIKTKGVTEEKSYTATADVFPGEDGFFIIKPIKEKKVGYSVEKLDRELNSVWEKRYTVETGIATAENVLSQNGKVMIVQMYRPKLISKKVDMKLICLEDKTGNDVFVSNLGNGESTLIPTSFLVDKDQNVVAGGMYFDGEKYTETNSDGIFLMKYDKSGKELFVSKDDWDNGLKKAIAKNTKSTVALGTKPRVYFHSITESEKGYQIISETFRMNYQLVSSGLKDLITGRWIGSMGGDDNKPITFEVLDFLVFNYSNDGKLSEFNIIEKEHTKISCYYPYNRMAGLRLAHAIKSFRYFDYAFTTKMPGQTGEFLISCHYSKNPNFGITSLEPDKMSETKHIPIDKRTIKDGSIGVLKNNPGKVVVFIYNRKEENLILYTIDVKP
ncbi:MAG: DUF6770 family protein [Bacteroidota bacterium]